MWKEILTIEDMEKIVFFKTQFGCARNFTAEAIKNNLERKIDCHYYYYKLDKIELLKGYKEKDGFINLIAYTIKADIIDYPKATRLMGEHAKEYIKNRKIKKLIIYYGSEDIDQMNNSNIGVSKIGFSDFMKIVIEEYGKLGFKTIFGKKTVINELI